MFTKARKDVRSVFGTYSIGDDAPELTANTFGTDGSVYDYLVRADGKDGLQAKIIRSDLGIEGIKTPTAFLKRKQADLVKIVSILKKSAQDTFERYMKRNIPIKEARDKTRKDLDTKFLSLMKDHEEDFPKSVLDTAVKKLVGV